MMSAEEARKISGQTPEEILQEQIEYAENEIKNAAKNKKRKTTLRNDFWVYGGYNITANYKSAVKILEEHGYQVNFHYDCGGQFVDMYTIVEW